MRAPSSIAFVSILSLALGLLVSREARAETTTNAAFDVGVVTEVPIMIGAQATAELPYGILLQGELGAMPGFYTDAIGAVVTAAGADAAVAAPLLHAGLDGSLVTGISAGWRPFREHGLEILGGYTLMSLGGTTDAGTIVQQATGTMLPAYAPLSTVSLHSTLHNVHVSLGWRWLLGNHVVVRTSVGYLQTLASSSHLEIPAVTAMDPNATADMAALNQAVDKTLDTLYRQYVKAPVMSVSVSYRF